MRVFKGVAAVSAVVMAVAITVSSLMSVAQAFDDGVEERIDELAQMRIDEIGYELTPLLLLWSGQTATLDDYGELPFSDLTRVDQAAAVIAVIEKHHEIKKAYIDRMDSGVLAVLASAVAIDRPSDLFDTDGRSEHPLLQGIAPSDLTVSLPREPMGPDGMGELLRDALRLAWTDYTGRNDLSGMIGEESPSEFELWLFEARENSTSASASIADPSAICQDGFSAAWACQAPGSDSVEALCVGEGTGEQLVQFRSGVPGGDEAWVLPAMPMAASEVMEFWLNDGTLVSYLEEGPQSLTFLQSAVRWGPTAGWPPSST